MCKNIYIYLSLYISLSVFISLCVYVFCLPSKTPFLRLFFFSVACFSFFKSARAFLCGKMEAGGLVLHRERGKKEGLIETILSSEDMSREDLFFRNICAPLKPRERQLQVEHHLPLAIERDREINTKILVKR